ncbi:P-loop containing nucleoside triphosphate hydrolase protein [Powellomyces hirtus]|nr:P-loop containing nucleoside triphosphate hydrolase protein [Powellomyces hirtus]
MQYSYTPLAGHDVEDEAQHDEIQRPFLSNILLSWIDPLVRRGYQHPLEITDLGTLPRKQQAEHVASSDVAGFWEQHRLCDLNHAKPPGLVSWLVKLHARRLILAVLLRGVVLVTSLALPFYFVPQVLQYLNPKADGPTLLVNNGPAIAAILCALQIIQALCSNAAQLIALDLQVNITAFLSTALYEKTLRLSLTAAARDFPPAHILTIVHADVQKVGIFATFINATWAAPCHILTASVLLANLLGRTAAVPITLFVAFIAIQTPFGKAFGTAIWEYMGAIDARTKILREFLYGIKVVKYTASEPYFATQVKAARALQAASVRLFCTVAFGLASLKQLQDLLVPVITFMVFAARAGAMAGNATPFATLGIFASLATPFTEITDVVTYFSPCKVSLRRIAMFLQAKEADPADTPSRLPVSATMPPISLSAASFTYEDASPTTASATTAAIPFALSDLTLDIPAGSLTAVVGPCAAGKSSLLTALAGSLRLTRGKATLTGSIAYCPQEPWIVTGTLKENVLLNRDAQLQAQEEIRLRNVLSGCQLERDLTLLPHGVDTQIGEKGVNLSGGQKSRVSLARAAYRDADIYLLDDPMASLDAHVGARVFEDVVCRLLRDKTVVFATHQLHLLPRVDNVVVMAEGKIVQCGAFETLMREKDGPLAAYMRDYKFDDEPSGETEEVEQVFETPDATVEMSGKRAEMNNEAPEEKTPTQPSGQIAAEERQKGAITLSTINSYLHAGGGLLFTIAVFISFFFVAASSTLSLLFLSWWSSDAFGWMPSRYIALYGSIGAVSATTSLLINSVIAYGGYRAGLSFHDNAMMGLMAAPLSFFESHPDIDLNFPSTFLDLFASASTLLASLLVIATANPALLILFAILAGIYAALFRYYQCSFRELKRLQSIMRSPLVAHVAESLTGLPTIRAFADQPRLLRAHQQNTDLANLSTLLYNATRLWFLLRLTILSTSVVGVVVLLAPHAFADPATTAVAVTAAISLSSLLINFFICLGRSEAMFNAVERLNHYATGLPAEAAHILPTDPPANTWPMHGALTLENLTVTYPRAPRPAINNLSLTIRPGEKIAVCGRTGAGKTTLLAALARLLEPSCSSGTIAIDGMDIDTLGLHTLRNALIIVSQDPPLFAGTVRSNLVLKGAIASTMGTEVDESLWAALDKVGLRQHVSVQPGKLDAVVHDGGSNWSAGHRQLLCLARAVLLSSSPSSSTAANRILILDEASSAVDSEADRRVQEFVNNAIPTTTVICIAHRLTSVAAFDRVLVMDGGAAVEFANPWELLNHNNNDNGSTGNSLGFESLVKATGPANEALIRKLAREAHYQKAQS